MASLVLKLMVAGVLSKCPQPKLWGLVYLHSSLISNQIFIVCSLQLMQGQSHAFNSCKAMLPVLAENQTKIIVLITLLPILGDKTPSAWGFSGGVGSLQHVLLYCWKTFVSSLRPSTAWLKKAPGDWVQNAVIFRCLALPTPPSCLHTPQKSFSVLTGCFVALLWILMT